MGVAAALGRRDIQGMFFKRLEERSMASWAPVISHMFNSDQVSEIYRFLGQVPALTEWLGSRKKKEPNKYAFTIINKKYEGSVEFAKDDLRRDKTTQIRTRIGDLAARAAILPQKVLTQLLIDNATAYDGQSLYADRSSLSTGGAIDNAITATVSSTTAVTAAEMQSAILGAIQTHIGALDDEGEPMNEFAREFVWMVPTAQWGPAQGAVRDQFTSAGASNTLRAIIDSGLVVRPIVNPRLTSGVICYLFRIDSDVKPLIWQDEVMPMLDSLAEGSDYEFFNDAHVYGTKRIGNAAPGEPGMTVQTTLST